MDKTIFSSPRTFLPLLVPPEVPHLLHHEVQQESRAEVPAAAALRLLPSLHQQQQPQQPQED